MRVGVILTARAPVPFLAEALDSVLAQASQVVVVDHASSPALKVRADVRVVRVDDPSGGPAAARGFGFVCGPSGGIRYRRHEAGLTSDVLALGEAGLAIHRRHASLVPDDVAQRAQARDLRTVARGQVRIREYGAARAVLAEA